MSSGDKGEIRLFMTHYRDLFLTSKRRAPAESDYFILFGVGYRQCTDGAQKVPFRSRQV